jgi:hypothetical protein
VSLAPELPETALFGVATEVVVTVFLLLYVIAGVRKRNAVPVIAELTLQDGPAAAQVAAVLLSPRKLVVGRDGRHYGIGDRLPDGTLVAGIDEDSARFVRDGLEETLRF